MGQRGWSRCCVVRLLSVMGTSRYFLSITLCCKYIIIIGFSCQNFTHKFNAAVTLISVSGPTRMWADAQRDGRPGPWRFRSPMESDNFEEGGAARGGV